MVLVSNLSSNFPPRVRQRGDELDRYGAVRLIHGDAFAVSAIVHGSQPYSVQLEREKNDLFVSCECAYFLSDGACKHIWAAILSADRKNLLLGQHGRPPVRVIEDWIEAPAGLERSQPKPRPTPERSDPDWRILVAQARYRDEPYRGTSDSWRPDRELYYLIDIQQTLLYGDLYIEIAHRDRKKNGDWGKAKTTRFSRRLLDQIPPGPDRDILVILGGSPDYTSFTNTESIPHVYRPKGPLLDLILPKMCATGNCRARTAAGQDPAAASPLAWDDAPPWQFSLRMEREGASWAVRGQLDRLGERMELSEPLMLIEGGFLIARDAISCYEHHGHFGWIGLLRRQGRVVVPAAEEADFLHHILTEGNAPRIEWPSELGFEEVTTEPRPRFAIADQPRGGYRREGALYGRLAFDYAGLLVPAEDPSPGRFDTAARQFLRRDNQAEDAARQVLAEAGLKPPGAIQFGAPPAYEIPARRLPQIVRHLLQAGWRVEAEGKLFRRSSGFRAEISSGIDWFELHGSLEYEGQKIGLPALLKALRQGANMIQLGDGSYGILPEDLLERYGMLIGLGTPEQDHVRFTRAQTGLLDAILAAREEICVDDVFQGAREQLRNFERILPAPQPVGFAGQLRGYQREGLAWMEFLRQLGFGGCLADDMGVGKTPQVLALLENRRAAREAGASVPPSLIVVPRSLIYNWKQEAERFTPRLRVLDHSGTGRSREIELFNDYDAILTTYGTMRRDALDLQNLRFDYVILDEAQAIKNCDSESAKAARILQADHRLVMTGTPIENHLGELWSLFEFLNPGMLGAVSTLGTGAKGMRNPDEETRGLLARAVRPYILRRTKAQVAPELPPKSEQTVYCELDASQRKLYNELRDHYRQSLIGRIDRDGMAKSKMQILEGLLRLRQAACHPGLLDKQRTGETSAKLEALIPQLGEVIDEHKALVFSQFTSLLAIVRKHLERASMTYEYLDGQTRDRQERVERFQNDPDCRLFLISLKAGGLGLNLTAAEYVFLLDPWWNPAVEAQAVDRAHRIGQTEHVFAYRLIARDTVEEKVLELQNSKRDLADSIIRADANLVRNLKREDLEFLFS
jgi:superfamily II DNA or RNA helicase